MYRAPMANDTTRCEKSEIDSALAMQTFRTSIDGRWALDKLKGTGIRGPDWIGWGTLQGQLTKTAVGYLESGASLYVPRMYFLLGLLRFGLTHAPTK